MFETIVWATDGSENSDRALPYARELASHEGARLVVVHIKEVFAAQFAAGLPIRADENEVQTKVERQAAELATDGVEVEVKFGTVGSAGTARLIADAARDAGADVLIAGTRGHGALAGLLVGSVTQRLLHISPCPVLAVPADHARGRASGAEVAAAAV
jgi:nucleotide-binding universal stress UspA family protein